MTDERYHRRSIRLHGYDYTLPGAYFVTICTAGRACLFGEVVNGEMILNEYGRIMEEEWARSGNIRREMTLDAFVVMPNHLHGVVILNSDPLGTATVGAHGRAPLRLERAPRSLGAFVAGFKSAATKGINALRGSPGATVWQRNYYEHIIRDDADLEATQWYILDNPARWGEDPDNPAVNP